MHFHLYRSEVYSPRQRESDNRKRNKQQLVQDSCQIHRLNQFVNILHLLQHAQYSGLIELDTLILDNTIHYRGEHEYKTSVQNLYQ